MLLILRILADDPAGEITAAAWKIISGLAVTIAGMATYIVHLHVSKAEEIKKLYEERISDLKAQNDLVETLLNVIDKERKGG
jgi:flagellar motor component MotA